MTTTQPETLALPLGTARSETVNRSTGHLVLCHGTQVDPNAWTPIAWLGGTDIAPVAEVATDRDPETRGWVEGELRRRIDVDAEFTTYVGILVDGVPRASWRGSLAHRVGGTGHWYGDMHWRHVGGTSSPSPPGPHLRNASQASFTVRASTAARNTGRMSRAPCRIASREPSWAPTS